MASGMLRLQTKCETITRLPSTCLTIELRVWMTTNSLVSGRSQGHKMMQSKWWKKSDWSGRSVQRLEVLKPCAEVPTLTYKQNGTQN